MPHQPSPPGSLSALIAELDTVDPQDTAAVLTLAWTGLRLSRLLGLHLAASDRQWRALQGNAEAVEHTLAAQLRLTIVLPGQTLRLPDLADLAREHPAAADIADATSVLERFTGTLQRILLQASNYAPEWSEQQGCRNGSVQAYELREAWAGNRPSYRHVPLPVRDDD